MRKILIVFILLLLTAGAQAQEPPGEMSVYLPGEDALAGWELGREPRVFRGQELFRMINGGADVFHEYGFKRTLEAQYLDPAEKLIKLEIFEMKSPAAAYGVYTFRIGSEGKTRAIGQEALLEDYYLNFWKGNFLVTVVGPDPEEKTVQSVLALAKAAEARIPTTGQRPDLAKLLLRPPLEFSNLKYIRGPLGLMSSYIFDTKNIFRVKEGLVGTVEGCQAFVLRYADQNQSKEVFNQALAGFQTGSRFSDQVRVGDRYSMRDRKKNLVLINRTGRHLAIVLGQDQEKVRPLADRLAEKLGKQ